MKNKNSKKLQSTFTFNKKQAKAMCKIDYYQTQARNIKMYEFLESEKSRLATPRSETITTLIEHYKTKGNDEWESSIGKSLLGIYKKNKEHALKNENAINSNLMNILARPEMLLLAYKQIKGNKGAMTSAGQISSDRFLKLNPEQKKLYLRSITFPDKFNLEDVILTAKLLRKGLYPWGTSSRVYVPKPGVKDKMRPITIPPFLDRVIQKAISMILETIYEPEFELLNRSFGFRPNKGVHDALTVITSKYSSGKRTAIEGDIEAAYDTVNKDILINILGQKIKDRKFLELIRERLNYEYEYKDKETSVWNTPEKGIPQGGIDSPYLFNIYMHELDKYVHKDIQDYINVLNEKLEKSGVKRKINPIFSKLDLLQEKKIRELAKQKRALKNNNDTKKRKTKDKNDINNDIEQKKEMLYNTIREIRLIKHKKNRSTTRHPHKISLKILYVRYADDWILLTNGNKEIANSIKRKISEFLLNKLELKLSDSKTAITDITKEPAKFLGFELKHPAKGPLIKKPLETKDINRYKKANLQRKAGGIIWTTPDKQRLINRLHMKGFCDKNGFPKELPWLSCLEPQIIIERYNASMIGLAQYYMSIIRNKADIQRWIYILRFSCLKTLAQKYKTSIKGIYKKFGINRSSKSSKTVKVTVQIKTEDDIMEKDWTLYSYKSIKEHLKNKNNKERERIFWEIEKDKRIGDYVLKTGKIPTVTNDDYLDTISWVSLRTQASMDMPCANCGTFEEVHQHHIRHIRKTAYDLLPENMDWKKLLALRNRKQIPLCKECHIKLVHKGKYDRTKLIHLVPTQKLIDNRIVHVESYVKPGLEYHSQSLLERGWKIANKKLEEDPET
jgi:hypothetical protein